MLVPSVFSCFIFYCGILKKSKEIKFLVYNENLISLISFNFIKLFLVYINLYFIWWIFII